MLAVRLPVTINYLVLPTLLSFLVCVLVVGVALEAVTLGGARILPSLPRQLSWAAAS